MSSTHRRRRSSPAWGDRPTELRVVEGVGTSPGQAIEDSACCGYAHPCGLGASGCSEAEAHVENIRLSRGMRYSHPVPHGPTMVEPSSSSARDTWSYVVRMNPIQPTEPFYSREEGSVVRLTAKVCSPTWRQGPHRLGRLHEEGAGGQALAVRSHMRQLKYDRRLYCMW